MKKSIEFRKGVFASLLWLRGQISESKSLAELTETVDIVLSLASNPHPIDSELLLDRFFREILETPALTSSDLGEGDSVSLPLYKVTKI